METLRAVFCFDENLTAQVQAAAASLLASSAQSSFWEIHCVCTAEAAGAEVLLTNIVNKSGGANRLVMHCLDNPFAGAYEVRGVSTGTYLRLLLPSLLSEIDKILYLDADVLVREDLTPLWEIPLAGKTLAAVKGPVNMPEKWAWNAKRPYWHLLGERGGYVNAGVTLLHLTEIRERGLPARWREMAGERFYYQDQDILNITCRGSIAFLPPKYNRLAYLSKEDYAEHAAEGVFTGAECEEALEFPAIVHYAGDKPWNRYDTNLGQLWWDFVDSRPELAGLFDEEKARKYRGPTLAQRTVRKVRRLFGAEE